MAVSSATAGPGSGAAAYEPLRLVVVVNWLEEFKRKVAERQ